MSILQINALKLNEKKRKLKFWNLALVCLLSLSQKLYEIKEICQHTTRNSQQSIKKKKNKSKLDEK
jgi:thymidine kinase